MKTDFCYCLSMIDITLCRDDKRSRIKIKIMVVWSVSAAVRPRQNKHEVGLRPMQ